MKTFVLVLSCINALSVVINLILLAIDDKPGKHVKLVVELVSGLAFAGWGFWLLYAR
jgi:hypothetical protein